MGLFDRLRGSDDRVAFVGIDGVPYSLLADHRDEFENIAALMDEGTAGEIQSIVPPESSACWPALTTGVNPGETGVYGFQDRENGSYETYVPMGGDVQATRLWDRVQDAGREATVVNVPVTNPPSRKVTRMVSGFLSPVLDRAARPQEFADYLQGIDYRIDVNAGLGHEDKEQFLEDAHETIDKRQEAFKYCIEQDDWDLFFGVFMTTDRVNHFLFKDYAEDGEYREEFVDFYRKVDRYIGELRDMLDDDVTLVVASDHGFTAMDYEVKCNAWLREEGWLDFRGDHDYVLNLPALLESEGHVDVAESYAGEIDELFDFPEVDATVEDGDVVAGSEDAKDAAVAAVEDALPAVVAVGDDATTVDVVDHEVSLETRDDEGESEEVYRVELDLVSADGAAYVEEGAVVVLSDAVRDDVVAMLEGATPRSLGVDRDDTTTLVEAVTVEDHADGHRLVVDAADPVRLGTAVDPEADAIEYTHTSLEDISDDTKAYSLIPGRFYVNLEGREPRGSVPQEEYEEVRAELKEKLENLEGPDGEPVADRVMTKEEVFRGAHDDIAPDLVVVPNGGFDLKSTFKGRKNPFVEHGARNGMHSFDDTTLVIEDEDARIEDADLYDIAPTILDLLDVDYERGEFDGNSLV